MPSVPQPLPQDLDAALRGSGWEVIRVSRGQRRGVAVELVSSAPPGGEERPWVLKMPVAEIAAAIAPERVVTDLRLVLPKVLEPDWLSAPPHSQREDRASFTTFILDPALRTLQVALDVRPDLNRLVLRTVAWAVLPIAAGWLFSYWVFSRSSSLGAGRLHPAFHALVPLVMLTMMPFQTVYQHWFLYWPEWFLGHRWIAGVARFLPLLVIMALSAYPAFRIALKIGRAKQVQPPAQT